MRQDSTSFRPLTFPWSIDKSARRTGMPPSSDQRSRRSSPRHCPSSALVAQTMHCGIQSIQMTSTCRARHRASEIPPPKSGIQVTTLHLILSCIPARAWLVAGQYGNINRPATRLSLSAGLRTSQISTTQISNKILRKPSRQGVRRRENGRSSGPSARSSLRRHPFSPLGPKIRAPECQRTRIPPVNPLRLARSGANERLPSYPTPL